MTRSRRRDRFAPQRRVTNWGRWGDDDEAGALNLVTAAETRRAAGLVTHGRVVMLGQALGPDTVVPRHRKRVERFMVRDGGDYASGARHQGGFQFAEDVVSYASHSGTHIDALSHAWYGDALYNGHPSTTVRSTTGAQRCGAERLRPIVTRGVLLDVAAVAGAPLDVGDVVTREHLVAAADRAGVALEPGDAALIRTGWFGVAGDDPDRYLAGEPGLDLSAARWLAAADVAVVGADNYAIEAMPFTGEDWFPVHRLLIRDLGVPLVEGMVLDELAGLAEGAFLFVASAVSVVGSTAGQVCPIAVL
ncbi:MAG: cyclase family protein [Micromonosporaceae bacterium]|nr:cyclase family protein [Micromonosporaceae bacterium]